MAPVYGMGAANTISSHDEEGYDSENGLFVKPTKIISRQATSNLPNYPSGNGHNNNKVRVRNIYKFL